jgi:hypothetical protein
MIHDYTIGAGESAIESATYMCVYNFNFNLFLCYLTAERVRATYEWMVLMTAGKMKSHEILIIN